MIATDLITQLALDADPKAMQQIYFTGNLEKNAVIFFITVEPKEPVLDFSQGTGRLFNFICFVIK